MTITPEMEQKLQNLMKVFLQENQKLNLSALRDEDACWHGNILDSLPGADHIQEGTVLDIGTGGGFPLLPLAILLPNVQFTGLDSTQKKIDAIQRIVDQLGLDNVKLVCGRTEELGHDPALREKFDFVTARAVAPLNTLLEYASPFTKVGGKILCWKSMQIDQELQDSLLARAELSCQLSDQCEYELPGDWGKRQILVFEKRVALSDEYPREVGVPKKTPLI